jgi:hypothetical protein
MGWWQNLLLNDSLNKKRRYKIFSYIFRFSSTMSIKKMKTPQDIFVTLRLEEKRIAFYCCTLALGAEYSDIEDQLLKFSPTSSVPAYLNSCNFFETQALSANLLMSLKYLFDPKDDYIIIPSLFHEQKVGLLKNYLSKFRYFYARSTKRSITETNNGRLTTIALVALKITLDTQRYFKNNGPSWI